MAVYRHKKEDDPKGLYTNRSRTLKEHQDAVKALKGYRTKNKVSDSSLSKEEKQKANDAGKAATKLNSSSFDTKSDLSAKSPRPSGKKKPSIQDEIRARRFNR